MVGRTFGKDDLYRNIKTSYQHVKKGYSLGEHVKLAKAPKEILVCGVGSASLVGQILKSCFDVKVPVHLNTADTLPKEFDKEHLLVLVSYSGNSDEVVSCYTQAMKRSKDTMILGVSAGGKLKSLMDQDHKKCIQLPWDCNANTSLIYSVFSIVKVLENSGLLTITHNDLLDLERLLARKGWEEKAEEVASKLQNKRIFVWCSESMKEAGLRWKYQLSELAKEPARLLLFPEAYHTDLEGLHGVGIGTNIILLNDAGDNPTIKRMLSAARDVIREQGADITEIGFVGKSRLTRLFSAMYLGDFTSYYLADKQGKDPVSRELTKKVKRRL